ncbi:MAG: hypothetical protein AB1916_10925 [Thermodesulfobacteriota bacterium]
MRGYWQASCNRKDCGKLPGFNFYRTKIDWMAGIAVFNPKAAARLMAIKNA